MTDLDQKWEFERKLKGVFDSTDGLESRDATLIATECLFDHVCGGEAGATPAAIAEVIDLLQIFLKESERAHADGFSTRKS